MTTTIEQPQHMQNLEIANAKRTEMADLKAAIKCGDTDPVETILTTELPIRALDVLQAIPKVAGCKAHNALKACHLTSAHYLATTQRYGRIPMTDRQREVLAAYVDARVNGLERWSTT